MFWSQLLLFCAGLDFLDSLGLVLCWPWLRLVRLRHGHWRAGVVEVLASIAAVRS